jgi:hypothetical protein
LDKITPKDLAKPNIKSSIERKIDAALINFKRNGKPA